MNRTLVCRKIWARNTHTGSFRMLATSRAASTAPLSPESPDILAFRESAFTPQKPFHFKAGAESPTSRLPAADKWFSHDRGASRGASLSPYMREFHGWSFPYELVSPVSAEETPQEEAIIAFRDWLLSGEDPSSQILGGVLQPAIEDLGQRTFFQLYAPLQLLIKALEFNRQQADKALRPVELYIAQSSLTDLPEALRADLTTPELVLRAGRGDVYNSSIWLGTEPTYTPLHRDPNPNLFCQLCSRKVARLLPPAQGDRLFFQVQSRLHQQANSRIRTTAMMEGVEREVLHEAIWGGGALPEGLYEAELGPGDALFIPKGWWHSVKSRGLEGQLNGSVNWWFR